MQPSYLKLPSMLQEKEKQILRRKKGPIIARTSREPEEELLSFILGTGMPRQPLLVEGDDNLRAADIGFTSRDKVGLIRVFPKKQTNKKIYILDVWNNTIIKAWNWQSYLSANKCLFSVGKTSVRRKKHWFFCWNCQSKWSQTGLRHHGGTSFLFSNIEHLRKQC